MSNGKISRIATDARSVYAFRIEGGAGSEDLATMAEVVDEAFDRHGRINMLLILHDYHPSDAVSSLSLRSLATQVRSVSHVERYAVVGPPPSAAAMIETFDKLSSIEARTFEPDEEEAAWAFVGARPLGPADARQVE